MTNAPETIFADKEFGHNDWDAGTFCTVNDGGTEYTRAAVAQARAEGFQERISELVALLDQQLGTPCEGIRHAQEIEESQAKIAELENALAAASGTIAAMRADRLADLPDMIAPLVWEGEEGDCFVQSEAAGYTYELSVCDTLERSCDYVWRSDVRYMGKTEVNIATKSTASFAEAKEASDNHRRSVAVEIFAKKRP